MTVSLPVAGKLDVRQTLQGRRILFIGATGFVGKVALSMLLDRYPGVDKLFVLTRAGAGSSSEERFFGKIAASPVFDPIRARFPDEAGFLAFLRERCVPLAGDVSRANLNFSAEDLARLDQLDLIVNCAGLVTFNPTLESAIRINVLGARNALDLARKLRCRLVHVSTCFVAGNRDGEIWEDDALVGYFPRRPTTDGTTPPDGALQDADFSVAAELADCQRIIEQQKALADDRAHVSLFRDRAVRRLRDEGRDETDPSTIKIALQRERKMWLAERLTELGMERAQHWGWTNTYTYTKALGDQLCAEAALATDESHVRACIVRPAIVESALRFPFPGWNEGFTTTAPLAYMNVKGHRSFPAGEGVRLDVIPVDHVAAGLIMAIAATIVGENDLVYQLGSSDSNPLYLKRAVELLGLHKRRYFKAREQGSDAWNALQARLEPVAVSKQRFERTSAPIWRSAADKLSSLIERETPRWGAPRLQALAARAREQLATISAQAAQTEGLFTLFMPFIHDRRYVFRCDHVRSLFARLTEADQRALPWDPEKMEWRDYWLDIHMVGLEKWVFPSLDEELAQKPRSVYTYKDLLELFDAATAHHKSRTAMRAYAQKSDDGRDPPRYTYADLQRLATRMAGTLVGLGVAPKDRVLLVAENRPEWGIAYFAILKAGGVVVPVDAQASTQELERIVGWSQARFVIWSDRVADRLGEPALAAETARITVLLDHEPPSVALVHQPTGDELASLIFTSGTTGNPKGVMLSHRNFTSLLGKLASVFDLDSHDGLLSVLPLHHTLEFTAGLLMPLMRGAQVSYVDEVDADSLKDAFSRAHVTGMVGVPALFELFERNIRRPIAERGRITERLFDLVVDAMFRLRQRLPPSLAEAVLNIPRVLFWPIHKRFGGRLRLIISGGAALDPGVMKTLRGLGFNLYEGYGLTEAAPVLAVERQRTRLSLGSVGEPLPGVTLKIHQPDAAGVGEIIAQAPNVMAGYYENETATAETIRDGWLHTGDLGRIDDGKVYIVGRRKELILGPSGENIYPDELEELYKDTKDIRELSIVGLPSDDGRAEVAAALIVPSYGDGTREEVRAKILLHLSDRGARLPAHKRLRVVHMTDLELPKTATRKVKRREVVTELQRLERLRRRASEAQAQPQTDTTGGWVREILAQVSNHPLAALGADERLATLGFDSLMFTELGVALEAAGVTLGDPQALTGVDTVADLETLIASWGKKPRVARPTPRKSVDAESSELRIPAPLQALGKRGLDLGSRILYERVFETRIRGKANVPVGRPFLVASNHASHLDMGLVKHAIGEWGPRLVALAAKDYFFEDPLRRIYFENFTNLVPMDRHGSLRESLRLAENAINKGNILLIFPEGTRARDGVMVDFKPAIGYLALTNEIDVLPLYLEGTYGAMPSGALLPKSRGLVAHVGPVLSYESLRLATAGATRAESYRLVAQMTERAVRALAPSDSPDRGAPVALGAAPSDVTERIA